MSGGHGGRVAAPHGARARRAAVLLAAALPNLAPAAEPPNPEPKRVELREKLRETLGRLSAGLAGTCGYVLRDLSSGEAFEKNGDAVFPVASTIKLPVFLDLLREGSEGSIDLDAPQPIDPRQRVEGGGVLEKWAPPYPALSARQLAVLMIDFSDNYAANLLIDRLGMERVSRRLKSWGLKETLLRRRMMDLDAARAGRENVSTPREMAAILERLARGEILDVEATRQAIAVLKRNEGTPIKRGLPAGVESADKDGELDGVRCDAGIIFVPAGADSAARARALIVSVMTSYLADDAEGEAYIGSVTRAAYEYARTLALSSEYGRRIGP